MAKAPDPVPGVEPGDHVFVKHSRRGPIAVKVLAHGKDGFQGECEMGERHRVAWGDYLGHKSRVLQNYAVVEEGADGSILQDDKGQRRFMAGGGTGDEPPKNAAKAPPKPDDPLLDGMERLAKSLTATAAVLTGNTFFMAKAAPGPGLALKDVTDKRGFQTKRWVRTMPEQKGPERPAAKQDEPLHGPASKVHTIGGEAKFRGPDGEGSGKIVASGADGVTVRDKDGKDHQVRHEHLVNPGQTATPKENDAKIATPAPAPGDKELFPEEAVAALPARQSQPFDNEESLYAASSEALEHMKAWLDQGKGLCSQLGYETMTGGPDEVDMSKPGGMLFIAPLKSKKRAAEKVAADYGGDWSQLRDVTRASIAVDGFDDIEKTVQYLMKGGMKLAMKPKDRFAKPLAVGYRDLLLNVEFPNGCIGELQLHLKPMLQAKAEGHKQYEVMRDIEAKPEDQWSGEERGAFQKAFSESRSLYDKAWSAAGTAGNAAPAPGGETMAKALESGALWDFFDRDGALFRRPRGNIGGVTHVRHGEDWVPYKGNRMEASLYGDCVDDPDKGKMMAKADSMVLLFFEGSAEI